MKALKPLLTLTLCLNLILLKGQDPIQHLNDQLRNMMAHLDKPHNPARWFLYDMAVHMTKEEFFTNNCSDTTNVDNWLMMYEEMRNSAYDTTAWALADSIYLWTLPFTVDTIVIGLMDFDFYQLKDTTTWTSDTYFEFDTINHVFYDQTQRPSHPFTTKNLFTVSPLKRGTKWLNPVIRIDPDFLFIDDFNTSYYNPEEYEFQVDFDDGLGYLTFSTSTISHHVPEYEEEGLKVIKARIWNSEAGTVKSSVASFKVTPGDQRVPPDETWNFITGLRIGVYKGCNNEELKKVIIYLEGIDIMEERPVTDIYKHIQQTNLAQLQNHGYDFLVVDWKNSRKDMATNAMHVVELIDYLKDNMDMDNSHQFVVIGESMGGVIGRYALTYMESEAYFGGSHPYKERMHNTRLFISYDAPHQGANVPLSIQALYRDLIKELFGPFASPVVRVGARAFNLFLDATAARQLLIYHIGTKNPFCNTSGYPCYSSKPARDNFMDDLIDLKQSTNGYPEYCKNVALSNGSLFGGMQVDIENGYDRAPNDYLYDLQYDAFVRVFGSRIKLYGADLELHTNPDGQGDIFKMQAGTWNFSIRLYWFGVSLQVSTSSVVNRQEYADVLPYCVNPGSIIDVNPYLPTDLHHLDEFYELSISSDGFHLISSPPSPHLIIRQRLIWTMT